MWIFYIFYVFFQEFFAVLTTFWRISAKKISCWRSCCAAGVPADASTVVAGLSSANDSVMSLLSQLLWPPPSMLLPAALFLQGFLLLIASILCWRSCCCFIPAVAFISAVACVPAVVSGYAVILNFACCWRYC